MSIQERIVQPKYLSQNLSSTGTTLYLQDLVDWDNTSSSAKLLSSADFGTVVYALLRNIARTQIEIIEIDPSTITAATSPITINKRALGYNGGTTADTETAYDWLANETIVELGSDVPQLLSNYVNITDTQTVAGLKTFSSIPKTTGGNPTTDTELARKAYVDATATGTTSIDRTAVAGNGGEAISAGKLVYLKTADGEWYLCDADTATSVNNVLLGIAQGTGSNGAAISGGVLLNGVDSTNTGLTQGDQYFAGNTAGALSTSAGTTEVFIGYGTPDGYLYFCPRIEQVLTENEQDAIGGNNGTPSSSNKFITQTGLQLSAENYAVDDEASDTYVVTLSPIPAAYVAGMVVRFFAKTANTGACTINVNGLGAADIKKYGDAGIQTLDNSDIQASQVVTLVYDGTQFILQGAPLIAVADAVSIGGGAVGDAAHHHSLYGGSAILGGLTETINGDFFMFGGFGDGMTETKGAGSTITRNLMITNFTAANNEACSINSPVIDAANGYIWADEREIVGTFKVGQTATQHMHFGMATPSCIETSIEKGFAFIIHNATLYAWNGDNSTAKATQINGITVTNFNTYKIDFLSTAGTIKFYVNGVLKVTHTENIPTGNDSAGKLYFNLSSTDGGGAKTMSLFNNYYARVYK